MTAPEKTPPRRGLIGPRDVRIYDALRRRPFVLAKFQWLKVRRMWRSLKGPAAVLVWTNSLWLIPLAISRQYQQIYARELGLSEVQVGYIAAVLTGGSMVCFLLGGWLTDRLGYKRSITLFDAIAWPGSMLALALAGRGQAWCFYLSSALMSFMTACVPAWHGMFVSGIQPERRAPAYGMMFITITAPGIIFPPLGGWLAARYGLVPAMRGVYFAAAALMTVGILIRWRLLPDIPAAEKKTRGLFKALGDQFRPYFRTLLNRKTWSFMLALICFNLDVLIGMSFVPLYIMEHLEVPKPAFSVVPAVTSVVRLGAIILLAPLITSRNTRRFFVFSGAMMAAGTLVLAALLLGEPGYSSWVLAVVLAGAFFWALGGALAGPAILGAWTNTIPEKVRNRLWGAHGAVGRLIACGALAGMGHLYRAWGPSLLAALLALEAGVILFFALSPVGTARSPKASAD